MASGKIPVDLTNSQEFSAFTFKEWRALDGQYRFWTERWRRTLDFLRGQHWKALQKFHKHSLPDWKEFPVINFTLAFYMDYIGDWLSSEIRYSAVPASPDPSDIDAAELAEMLLKFMWDKTGMESKRIDLGAWLMATGTGVLRTFWNTNTGNLLPLGVSSPEGDLLAIDPETLEPLPPGTPPVLVDAGEVDVEVLSPAFVRWGRSDQDGVMVGMLLTHEEARSLYGEEMADSLDFSDSHASVFTDLSTIHIPELIPAQEKRTLIIRHYLPRSTKNIQGLWWDAGKDGTATIAGPFPLPTGEIPITSFRWIPVPGDKHLGMTPLYNMTFSNKIYDEALARTLEWVGKMPPKILNPMGSGLAPGEITDEPWQELFINPGGEPSTLKLADPPAALGNIMNLAQQNMLFTGGHLFQKSKEIPAGEALQRVRAPDETLGQGENARLAIINSKAAWQKQGKIIIQYAAKFYTEPRVIAVQGPDRRFQWRQFSGKDLQNLEATIRVDDIPLFPWDRQSLKDTIMAVLNTQAGQIMFIGPDGQPSMERINKAVEATGLDVSIPTLDSDVVEARNEIDEFANLRRGDQPPTVQQWQNNQVHVDEKTRILKSMRFQAWTPEQQQALLANVQEHQQAIQQAAQARSQAMVTQERDVRQAREGVELAADVRRMLAQAIVDILGDILKTEIPEAEQDEE